MLPDPFGVRDPQARDEALGRLRAAMEAEHEFWDVRPGDVILAPFWPFQVTVEAASPLDPRFALVHWSAPWMSGVSMLSQHALVTVVKRWDPDLCGRYEPREVPVAAVVADIARTQYLAGIIRRRDNSALVREWATEIDRAAMSRGEYRTERPCGCWR